MTKSSQNRKELEQWYKKSGYDHISFYIPPNILVSQEAATAEVLAALKAFNPKTAKPMNGVVL